MLSHVRRSRYVETSVADIIFTTDLQIPEISRNEEGVDGVEIMEGTVEVLFISSHYNDNLHVPVVLGRMEFEELEILDNSWATRGFVGIKDENKKKNSCRSSYLSSFCRVQKVCSKENFFCFRGLHSLIVCFL